MSAQITGKCAIWSEEAGDYWKNEPKLEHQTEFLLPELVLHCLGNSIHNVCSIVAQEMIAALQRAFMDHILMQCVTKQIVPEVIRSACIWLDPVWQLDCFNHRGKAL